MLNIYENRLIYFSATNITEYAGDRLRIAYDVWNLLPSILFDKKKINVFCPI